MGKGFILKGSHFKKRNFPRKPEGAPFKQVFPKKANWKPGIKIFLAFEENLFP